jgi:hypothetical protein
MRHHQGIAVSAHQGLSTLPLRQGGLSSFFAAAITLLSGCAATLQGRAQPQQTARDPPGAAPQANTLAERAKRDVDQLQQLGLKPGIEPATSVGGAAQPRPEIQWILPPQGQVETTPGSHAGQAAQEPLARDRPQDATAPAPKEFPGGHVEPPAPDADRIRRLVVDLCAELYRQGAYSQMPLRELLLIAATSMVTPDRSLVPDALPGLTERERELLGRMQGFFAELGRGLQESGDPESIVKAIEQVHQALSRQPQLVLPRAALCTRVGGFGDYDEFARNEAGRYSFLAHTGQQAVVYVEVDDFTSTLDDQGQWVTDLSQQLVLYSDRDGIPVWREGWQPGRDASRNRRDDFFIVQIITLPKQLSIGRYQLKIHVRDEKSRAEAETALDVEMVADPRMTSGN